MRHLREESESQILHSEEEARDALLDDIECRRVQVQRALDLVEGRRGLGLVVGRGLDHRRAGLQSRVGSGECRVGGIGDVGPGQVLEGGDEVGDGGGDEFGTGDGKEEEWRDLHSGRIDSLALCHESNG